jgi:putative membrane protein
MIGSRRVGSPSGLASNGAQTMDEARVSELVIGYTAYLLTGLALLAGFFVVYTRLTPYDERQRIRDGNVAVAVFFSGAMIGFTATIASGILSHAHYGSFVAWSLVALVVQLLVYAVMQRMFPNLQDALESGNLAVGMLGGAAALSAGLINAACVF